VAGGWAFTATVTQSLGFGSSAQAWGQNNAGQCTIPVGLGDVEAIAAGENHTVALIRVASNCPADLNGDGVVGGSDLGALLSNWGSFGTGDLNGDGFVTGADLGQLLAAWGPCS
jgi:hypothetical protein